MSSAYYSKVDNISVFVSTVQCHGNETNLLGCAYNLRGIHDYCNSTTDAGVNCKGPVPILCRSDGGPLQVNSAKMESYSW